MGNHFYGHHHWELCPVEDRLLLLDALEVFCDGETDLFIEALSPSLVQRLRFWRMRSPRRTHLVPDALLPRPSIFHVALNVVNLRKLKAMVQRDGLSERSIAHLKGYAGERGLFWFHGFCDQGDQTLACSRHVDEATIERLESKLNLKAEKKLGELKSDREWREEIGKILAAMDRSRDPGR